MAAQKLQCLQKQVRPRGYPQNGLPSAAWKETANLAVVIAKVLVVVVVILATQSGDGWDVFLQLLSRDSRKNSGA